MDLLVDLNKNSGTTLILVTHDPNIADRAKRVIHLYDGQIEKDNGK